MNIQQGDRVSSSHNPNEDIARDLAQLEFAPPRFGDLFPPKRKRARSPAAGAIALGVLLAGAIGASAMTGILKLPVDPWAWLTDTQRQREVDRAQADAAAFVAAFMASGQDLRSLPRKHLSAFDAIPTSLRSALADAEVVVVGTVSAIEITPSAGLPNALVSLDVERTVKGQGAAELTLLQVGGPAPAVDGSAELVDLEAAPLLLPGDRVLLIALRLDSGSHAGALVPQPGTGIVYLEDGRAAPLASHPEYNLLSGVPEARALDIYGSRS